MFPTIPDSLNKLILALGIFMVGFACFRGENESNLYNQNYFRIKLQIDSINNKQDLVDNKLEILKGKIKDFSIKYNIKNPLTIKDSLVVFTELLRGNKRDVSLNNELKRLWTDYKEANFQFKHDLKKASLLNSYIKELSTAYHDEDKGLTYLLITGGVCAFFGFFSLVFVEIKEEILSKLSNILICQSCAKRFNGAVQNAKFDDGEINRYYCKDCFANDQFTDPNLTEEIVYRQLISTFKKPSVITKLLIRTKIKKLYRWSSNPY